MTSHMKSDVKLYFLGNRNYVQGLVQLKFALKSIQKELGITELSGIYVRRYKQMQETDTPVEIICESENVSHGSLRATLELVIAEEEFEYKIVAVPGELARYTEMPYSQFDYKVYDDTLSSVRLSGASDFWEIIKEAVQLTKIFHIQKYNKNNHYKFVVGGFERFQYVEIDQNEAMEIKCQIVRHICHKDTIYNYTRITVANDYGAWSFIMPFIGKK